MTDNRDRIIESLKSQVAELKKTAELLVELNQNSQDAINNLKNYFDNSQKILAKLQLSNNNAINSGIECQKLETKLVEVDQSDIPPTSTPPTSKPPTNTPPTSTPPTSKPPTNTPPTSKPPTNTPPTSTPPTQSTK
jgi:hypothetical protein